MKIKLKICCVNDEQNSWIEEYDVDCLDAKEYGENLIEGFNDMLRPGEKLRKLLEVIVVNKESIEYHDWHKTNLVTIIKNGMCYDTQRCSRCLITGKRYGLSGAVKRDTKYKAKVYQRCDTAKRQLEKLRNK